MDTAGRINAAALADVLRMSIEQGHQPTLTVTSNSMMPLLMRGDQVTLTAVPPTGPRPGDVITFLSLSGQDLMTHRFWQTVMQDGRPYFQTRGDRPLQFDPLLPPEQVIGRVEQRQRNGRILTISSGAGAKLNHHLARLAQWEQNNRPNRLIRRILLAWAFAISVILTFRQSPIGNRKS